MGTGWKGRRGLARAGAAILIVGLGAGGWVAAGPADPPAAADITFVDDEPDSPAAGQGPASPFTEGAEAVVRKDAVPGVIELSDGRKLPGKIYTTRGRRLKIYNLKREVYEYVPVAALKQIEVTVEWERMDKEWRFKEAGNPEKIYSGREYPVRSLVWTLTLRNDHAIAGHILGQPLYVEEGGKAQRFLLHQRDKGEMGQTLKDLVYVRRVAFGPEAYARAAAEAKAGKGEAGQGRGGP
jgi:hypothetical protein